MKNTIWLPLMLLLTACEKDINFNLDESPPTVVVDASIENGKAPRVILTTSLDYYSYIDPALIMSSFIHDAQVYISSGGLTHKLKEYSYSPFPGISAYYYSTDSADLSTAITGTEGGQYNLRVVSGGEEYLSQTSIPVLAVVPDSVWFLQAPFNPDSMKRIMLIRAIDPPGLGNYIRYYTKTNTEPFWPGPNSVFTDQIFDGNAYQGIFSRGYDPNDPPRADDNFFLSGDTVTVKFCNIDRATYDFWNTWEFALQSIGNPFAQPNTVLGNVSNGALGAFCGYAAWYGTYIIP